MNAKKRIVRALAGTILLAASAGFLIAGSAARTAFAQNDVPVTNGFSSGVSDPCAGKVGVACATGQPGVCAAGLSHCQNGVVSCVANAQASPEQCNGQDDDCNGAVDDCSAGTCLKGACAVFGGLFETSDAGCAACKDDNPYAGGCGCPAGFAAAAAGRTVNDCEGAGHQHGATLTVCQTPSLGATSDFGGVFEKDDPVGCGQGCRAPNPYTGDCSCPAGTTLVAGRTLVQTPCNGLIGATLGFCVRTGAAVATFGGAYQVDDPVQGGVGCRAANPRTGDCSCPAGTTKSSYRVEVDAPAPNLRIGSSVKVCVR